jgi:RNA-dependent RNA polymerase
VILFSAKGDRPEPEMLSGGDCDGDVYWICWEPEFLDNFNQHSPNEPKPKNTKIVKQTLSPPDMSSEDCQENFLEFLKIDFIGIVANLHSKLSDRLQTSLSDNPECQILSKVHNMAVDVGKFGPQIVQNEDYLTFRQIEEKYKDYVVNFQCSLNYAGSKTTSISPGVLGSLRHSFSDL